MQHHTCKTKDYNALDNTIDDVLDDALDAFNPGGRVRPWRTRSTKFVLQNGVATTVEREKTNVPSKGKSYQVVGNITIAIN